MQRILGKRKAKESDELQTLTDSYEEVNLRRKLNEEGRDQIIIFRESHREIDLFQNTVDRIVNLTMKLQSFLESQENEKANDEQQILISVSLIFYLSRKLTNQLHTFEVIWILTIKTSKKKSSLFMISFLILKLMNWKIKRLQLLTLFLSKLRYFFVSNFQIFLIEITKDFL